MIIGISIPSLITLLGGLFTYIYITNVTNRQSYVEIADDLKESALEIRRIEKNFLHYKNAEYLKNLDKAIRGLMSSIRNIPPKTISEIGSEDFSSLEHSMNEYTDLMTRLYKSYEHESEVVEKVRNEGRKLEEFVAKGEHAGGLTTNSVFNLRLLEKNYMLFRDKKSFMALYIKISKLDALTPFCHECAPYIESIHDLINAYKRSDSIVNDFQIRGRKIEETTGKIAGRERRMISSFLNNTRHLLLIAFVLLCILGPLFVYNTATYIAAPIHRLADITRKISEGDLSLRAPLKEHDETFTLAVSFNKMLDNLQIAHRSLEQSLELLQEKQDQLVEKQDQLVEAGKLASLGVLTAGVAHELTNPLNNISMVAQTFIELYKGLSDQDRIRFMETVEKETERTKKIINNLLSFSKPKEADQKESDINVIIMNALDFVKNMIHVSNIETKLNLDEGLPHVFIDEAQIVQVLINLLTNAVQAMEPGGVLTISTRPDREDHVEITVNDTGKGISPEHLTHIFDPFFSTKGVEGTGLGLSVSYGIIKTHKGNISVESKVGEGTEFTIELPVYKGENNEPV
jgi:two-component system NtrC family sensor kinase